jgi:hypothetical protein
MVFLAAARGAPKSKPSEFRSISLSLQAAAGSEGAAEQLADNAPGVAALELRSSCAQDCQAALGCLVARARQQAALADPGNTLHQQGGTAARAGRADLRGYRAELCSSV